MFSGRIEGTSGGQIGPEISPRNAKIGPRRPSRAVYKKYDFPVEKTIFFEFPRFQRRLYEAREGSQEPSEELRNPNTEGIENRSNFHPLLSIFGTFYLLVLERFFDKLRLNFGNYFLIFTKFYTIK